MGDDGYMDGDVDWNGEYKVKTVIGDGYWSLEARVTVDQLGATISKGDKWRLNFRRKQRTLGFNADWQVPIDYNPDTYGVMTVE
jgi:hypothetical protein